MTLIRVLFIRPFSSCWQKVLSVHMEQQAISSVLGKYCKLQMPCNWAWLKSCIQEKLKKKVLFFNDKQSFVGNDPFQSFVYCFSLEVHCFDFKFKWKTENSYGKIATTQVLTWEKNISDQPCFSHPLPQFPVFLSSACSLRIFTQSWKF